MLRNTSKWTEAQREIVLQFLRLHLKQQQTERLQLDATKNECREKGNCDMKNVIIVTNILL
jgi:hypothetical protein